jgi:PP-loop superfamily ATP-utilizing enzyme
MSKRLQVLLPDKELAEIRQMARREGMTTAEWVRQALRAARHGKPRATSQKKLDVIEAAARNAFPAPGIDQMLAEIEGSYVESPP